jgi:uroporphyrinogen decarboxylase
VPAAGAGRTRVYLETVERLAQLPGRPLVLGGCIGPFSLAARLVGMNEAFSLTVSDPDWVHRVLEKATGFLAGYLRAFRARGADGVVMAEPAAGLLSPRALAAYSSAYVRRLVDAVPDPRFGIVLHNCAAKAVHLPAVLESGAKALHFGAPMDLGAALAKAPADVVVCGNLDPTRVFHQSQPDEVVAETERLLALTRPHRNFVISSGCDVPAGSPLANLEAFFDTVARGERPGC